MNNRRELNKRLILIGGWATPLVQSISLPVHAQTSPMAPNVLGKWRVSRVDGGSPIEMGQLDVEYEIDLFENGGYRIVSPTRDITRDKDSWSVTSNGDFEYCIFVTKCNYGRVISQNGNIATKILIESGYTYISDILFERID